MSQVAVEPSSASEAPTRILVIDDEDFVRESLATYLADSGYETLEAGDGEAGFQRFCEERPDLILCDLRMPRMDGLNVLKKVHEISPDTPVIVVSGAGVIGDVVEALRLGASDYLIKPIVDLEVLEHAVLRSLERSRLREENRAYREKLEVTNRELAESLQLLRLDQEAGREVQLNMLPAAEMDAGEYRFTHHIIPSLYLSGDFVDYFPLSERYILFYIADVSGHGASSAFVTVLLKNLSYDLLRRVSIEIDPGELRPSRVLARLNQILLEVRMDKHMTCFLGILDVEEHRVEFAVGGHFPYPVLRKDGKAEFIEHKGLPVGLFEEAEYEDKILDLSDNCSLVLFSDGVLEILPEPTLQEKEQQLLRVIGEQQPDAREIAAALGVAEITEAPDDIAVLSLSRRTDGK